MASEGGEQKIWYCNTGSGQCQNLSPGEVSSGRFSGWNRVGSAAQKEQWTTQWNTQHPVEDTEDAPTDDIPSAAEGTAGDVIDTILDPAVTTGGETAAITQPGLLDYWEGLFGEYEPTPGTGNIVVDPNTLSFNEAGNIIDEEGKVIVMQQDFTYDDAGNLVIPASGFSFDEAGNAYNPEGNVLVFNAGEYTSEGADYQPVEGGDPGWLQQQIDYATSQAGLQADLLPLQLEALGYQYNDAGELEKIPLSPYEQALEDRRLAGMGYKDVDGELVELTPEELDEMVSPGLQSEIDKQTTLMEERLSRKGITPGSTGYSQAMSQLGEKVTSLKQQERQGWLMGSQGLLGAETARLMASTQTQLGNIGGLGTNVAAPPMPFSSYQGLLGTAAAGMQPYQYQQGLEYGILPTTMNLAANQGPGMGQMIGMVGGGALGWTATGGNPYGAMLGAGLGGQAGDWWDRR